MMTNKENIEILVRAFFYSYFSRAAVCGTKDISKVQPITIKQLLVQNIDDISVEFNKRIARAFAILNDVTIPKRLSEPKTFEGATSLIRYTLKGEKDLFEHMVERYKYHFTLALSGTVEKTDNVNDTLLLKALEIMK